MKKQLLWGILFLILAGSIGLLLVYSQTEPTLQLAPLNPEFVKAMEQIKSGTFKWVENYGYLPGPLDVSSYNGSVIDDPTIHVGYPATYDLRTLNRLTPVRDQGGCGDCWAFGAFGSLEPSLMPGESRNFSEIHLARYHGFDWTECYGGNAGIAAAYLARWGGPYNEVDYPYPYASLPGDELSLLQKHIQDIFWLPARTSATDNDRIKAFVTYYEAVNFAFYWHASYYNATNRAFYSPLAASANHEICIVGWDDNYPASNFNTAPPGNGAFLCRNSWGAGWGDGGYFWMSYYNATITDLAVFYGAMNTSYFKTIYSYDPFGATSAAGYNTATAWAANVFTATSNDPLKGIGVRFNDPCTVYFSVYRNPTPGNPASGTLVGTAGLGASISGYFAFSFSPIALTTGDTFSIVAKYVNNSYLYPVPLEGYISGFTSAATNAAGQSYVSPDGITWADVYAYGGNSNKFNCCLKAFTGTGIQNVKNDFNGDGKDDILWRNNGSTGQNAVWYLGTAPASPEMQTAAGGTVKMLGAPMASRNPGLAAPPVFPPDDGLTARARSEAMRFDAQEGAAFTARTGSWNPTAGRPLQAQSIRTLATPAGGASIQSIPTTGYSFLNTVADLNYQIVGTGDFDGDGGVDILWRNVSTGQNAVWLMNGITYTGYAILNSMTDLTWKIVGTGDFNGDAKVDILWRNTSTGQNAVWCMNGAVYSYYSYLMSVTDLSWKIVGTGDFNGDGKVDILFWNSSTGKIVVWYMNGVLYLGYDYIDSYVADTNYRIAGVGDFNNDQKPDIVWRNYSTGQNAIWFLDGVKYTSCQFLDTISDMNWVIVNR